MSVRVNIQAIAARIGSNTLVTLSRTKWQLREEENGANGIWLLVRCINTVCDGSSAVKTVNVTTFMRVHLKMQRQAALLFFIMWS